MSFDFRIENDMLNVAIHEKRATVDISGKIKEKLTQVIESGNSKVIVDLSKVEYLDSSFLGALVAGLKRATMKNGDLKLVGLQAPVRAMFDLTRLYKIFDIFESTQDAENSF